MPTIRRCTLSFFLFVLGAVAQPNVRTLTILHTNDLHARLTPNEKGLGGFAYLKTLMDEQCPTRKACLVLNGGDLVQGTPVSTIFKGAPLYEIANGLGFDATVLGNHDFDYGWQRVAEFRKKAKFPVLSANVVDGSGRLVAGAPYVIKKVNGIRVAIVGVTMANLAGFVMPKSLGEFHTVKPVSEVLEKTAAELKGRYDLMVALAHVEKVEEREILEKAPSVQVTVAGHVHTGLTKAETEAGRVLVYCRANGVEMGRLDLKVDVVAGRVVEQKWTRIAVDAKKVRPNAKMAAVVGRWEQQVAKVVDVPIGEARRDLAKPEVKKLVEQAMAAQAKVDFAYQNAGGVRDVMPKGVIKVQTIWRIMPFDNKVVTARVKGADIPEIFGVAGKVKADQEYTIAVPDYVAENPVERKRTGLEKITFTTQDLLVRDAIVEWIRGKKVVE